MLGRKLETNRGGGSRSGTFPVVVVVAAGVFMANILGGDGDLNEPQLAIAAETSVYCDTDCRAATN